jgi:hypothetical protein
MFAAPAHHGQTLLDGTGNNLAQRQTAKRDRIGRESAASRRNKRIGISKVPVRSDVRCRLANRRFRQRFRIPRDVLAELRAHSRRDGQKGQGTGEPWIGQRGRQSPVLSSHACRTLATKISGGSKLAVYRLARHQAPALRPT